MTALASRTVDEADHVVRALAGMRVAISRLEKLAPHCCEQTAVMRVQMCEVLAWANAVKASVGALRMTGEIKAESGEQKVEMGNGDGGALGTMRPTGDGHALAGAATESRRLLESLWRSGDHSLDA